MLTYRFALAFGACAVLMGLSAYALVDEYALRAEAHEVEVVRARAELDNIKVYAQLLEYPPFTHRPPSPLAIFGEGLEDRLGNVLHFSHGSVPTLLSAPQDSNPLMHAFPVFDLATISALLLSLVALFFAYDSVSGERQAGTLSLLFSNPVPRAHLLLGKWLGGLACTGLPVVAGFVSGPPRGRERAGGAFHRRRVAAHRPDPPGHVAVRFPLLPVGALVVGARRPPGHGSGGGHLHLGRASRW